jgi:hypothetical protein
MYCCKRTNRGVRTGSLQYKKVLQLAVRLIQLQQQCMKTLTAVSSHYPAMISTCSCCSIEQAASSDCDSSSCCLPETVYYTVSSAHNAALNIVTLCNITAHTTCHTLINNRA